MGKSLSEYASENIKNSGSDANGSDFQGTPITDDNLQKAKDVINKYSSFSESELMKEIRQKICIQKELGLFNKEKLVQDIGAFSSFLSFDQIEKIKEIIDKIDAEN